ncbi:hypothetical protein ACSSV8_001424 [Roseovarius sp. MBR-79]|jgi:hypothetical protein
MTVAEWKAGAATSRGARGTLLQNGLRLAALAAPNDNQSAKNAKMVQTTNKTLARSGKYGYFEPT